MQTSKKKQQQTSSSSKKQKKVTIKNILASPFANYWPALVPEDNNTITELLKINLPRIKKQKFNVPWCDIKNVPREERKTFRANLARGNVSEQSESTDRSNIVLGVNQVTVALEEKSLSAVVIANDVQPRFMVKHIIDMCVLYSVPILIASDLRTTLQTTCGITSLVLGLRNTIKPNTKLYIVLQSIKRISENYPVPKEHINFNRKTDINENENVTKGPDNVGPSLMAEKLTGAEMTVKEIEDVGETQNKETSYDEDSDDQDVIKQIYLIKTTPDEEVFVPKFSGCGNTHSADKMEVDSTGFLQFSEECLNAKVKCQKLISEPKSDHKINYKSLVIKRLKGNSDRSKKKIDQLKNIKK